MANTDDPLELVRIEREKRRPQGEKAPTVRPKRIAKKTTPRSSASGRQYLIQDRDALAAAINDAIDVRFDGIRDAAAKAVGIPHSTLKRYHQKRGSAVRHDTLKRLLKLVGRERVPAIKAAVLSPLARDSLATYNEWVTREIRAIEFGSMGNARRERASSHHAWETELLAFYDRAARLSEMATNLRRRFPSAWKALRSRAGKGAHSARRVRLAWLRVVAPLLNGEDAGYIERKRAELSRQELERFVRYGAHREAILLARDSDIRRAQEVAIHASDI